MLNRVTRGCRHFLLDLFNEAMPKTCDDMLTQRQFEALYVRDSIAPFLPYGEIDEDGIWMSDNPDGPDNFMFGFELAPMIAAGDKTEEQIAHLISGLPPRTVAYSLLHLNYDVVEDTENWFVSQRESGNDLMQEMAYRRSKFILEWSEGKVSPISGIDFRPRKCRHLFVVKTPPLQSEITRDAFESIEKTYIEMRETIATSLRDAGMGIHQLSGKALARFCVRLVNPQVPAREWRDARMWQSRLSEDKRTVDQANPLRDQMAGDKRWSVDYRNGVIEHEDLESGTKRYSQVFSVVKFTEKHEFRMSSMLDAIGGTNEPAQHLPGDVYAYTMMEVLDREKDIGTTLGKKVGTGTWAEGFENSKLAQRLFSRARKQRENILMLHKRFIEDNETAVRTTTGVVVTTERKDNLKAVATRVKRLFGQKNCGMMLKKEDAICFPMYLASLPGFFRHDLDGQEKGLGRCTTMSAFNAATLCHFQGVWQGEHSSNGGAMTLSRLGSPVLINLFGTGASSFNFFVGAATGSGKSFFTNEMVRNALSRYGKVVLFDAGGSYKNINAISGGKYIDFKISDPVCLNPFSNIYSKDDLDENLDTLVEVITMLAYSKTYSSTSSNKNLTRKLPQASINHVNEAIETLWQQKGAAMSVKDIYDYCLDKSQHCHSEIEREEYRELHQGLRVWAVGSKAKWMVGENNLDLDNNFVVLELDGLTKDETLKAIVLYLLMQNVQDDIYIRSKSAAISGVKRETLVILDEAWALLDKPFCAEFTEKAYRQFRKFLASIGLIAQGFGDAERAEGGKGKCILENCNWIFALKQKDSAVKRAAERDIIDLDKRQQKLISSIQKNSDYSEFLVINTNTRADALCRFVTDKFTYAMYTSTAEQRIQIQKDVSKGMSRVQAIDKLARELEADQMFRS